MLIREDSLKICLQLRKFEEKGKCVFITYKDMTQLWFSFVFSSRIINEFFNIWYQPTGIPKITLLKLLALQENIKDPKI